MEPACGSLPFVRSLLSGIAPVPNRKDLWLVPSAGAENLAPLEWMIRKLESIGTLSDEDRAGIRALSGTLVPLRASEDIVSEGERPNSVCVVVDGLLCRYKLVPSGERQIMSYHVPGDVPDVLSLLIERMDHSICTLTPSMILKIPHAPMLKLFQDMPNIAFLFWRATLVEAAVFREWMVGMGRRSSYTRMAHMFCEVMMQMKAVGLTDGKTCHLPLTQAEIADATGISTVHVNRTLQELRARHLITFEGGSLDVLDWEGLEQAGEFDPSYLHLRSTGAS
jgi:CRP-like cAMP-binding protein